MSAPLACSRQRAIWRWGKRFPSAAAQCAIASGVVLQGGSFAGASGAVVETKGVALAAPVQADEGRKIALSLSSPGGGGVIVIVVLVVG